MELAREAHLGWVRISLRWSGVEPAPGRWDWGLIDQNVWAARAHGLRVLAMLNHVPRWAGGGPRGNVPPRDPEAWREFVRRTARRYRGEIDAYEIWNEPDLRGEGDGVGWDADLDESPTYADLLHAAAVEIRREAPGTLVVGPSLSSRGGGRARQVWRQLEAARFPEGTTADLLDAVSVHQNVHDGSGARTWARRFLERSLGPLSREAPSLARKPVWVTELGWKSQEAGEDGQAEGIADAAQCLAGAVDADLCREIAAAGVTHAFIYKLIDFPGESWGLYGPNGRPKRVVTEVLRELAFPARVPRPGISERPEPLRTRRGEGLSGGRRVI